MSDRPSKDYPDTENRVSLQRLLVVFINGLYVKKSLQDVYIAYGPVLSLISYLADILQCYGPDR